jgi:hypothetical protein
MTATPQTRSATIESVVYSALLLSLVNLVLVLRGDALGPSTAVAVLRALVACLALPIAGLPVALLLVRRRTEVGAFTLFALALAFALLLDLALAVILRTLCPPISGLPFALLAVVASAATPLLGGPHRALRVGLEPGLDLRSLACGLVIVILFGAWAGPRLFGGLERFVPLTLEQSSALREEPAPELADLEIAALRGALLERPGRWRLVASAATLRIVPNGREPRARLVFAVVAPPGTTAALWRVAGASCGLAHSIDEQQLATARVPDEVLGVAVAPMAARLGAVLHTRLVLPREGGCFELRLALRGLGPVSLVEIPDVSRWEHERGRLALVPIGAAECHLSDAHYRAHLRRSNQIQPELLLWGYFTQLLVELQAGRRDPALGVLFLWLALLCFTAALVMVGAVAGADAPTTRLSGLLLLGPLLLHLWSLTCVDSYAYAFPDTPFAFFLLAALALLLRRELVGFVLLGCIAAYTRYPGAYVLALALVTRLIVQRDDRLWTRRALIWSLGGAALVVGLLLVHFHLTVGVGHALRAVYSEIFPEHFAVVASPRPAWLRAGAFLARLAGLCSLTLALWPLAWRSAAGRLLIAVTLGYALPLLVVHVPHPHYFPPLTYCAAAAGLGGLALARRRGVVAIGVAIVASGTLLGFTMDALLSLMP